MARLLLAAFVAALPAEASHAKELTELELKAAFLFNFAKFTTWPKDAFRGGEGFEFCVIGDDPAELNAFAPIVERGIGGREVELRYLDAAFDPGVCDLAFITESASDAMPDMAGKLDRPGLLSIGEDAGFAANGGVISLYRAGNRIRFKLNLEAARRRGLSISSQLLRLAEIVKP